MPVKTIYHRMKGLNTRMMKNYRHGIGPTRVVMLLTTIGRKSCLPRQTPLQYEEVDGDYYIASARGRDADWFKNIVANPKVLVQSADAATRAAVSTVFVAVHQYGGVILGEHIGQFFTIIWMVMISTIIYKSPMFAKWVAGLGWIASAVYLLAQTELLATAIPDFRVVGWAGLAGSLLWLLWMIALGFHLIRNATDPVTLLNKPLATSW